MIRFELDAAPGSNGDGSADTVCENYGVLLEGIFKNNGKLVDYEHEGPGGGNPCFHIEVEKIIDAYHIVEAFYGPENSTRETNYFYVFGKEVTK
jgi:hypothetical protein